MAISDAYQETLKRRAVQSFIAENKRRPTEAELRDLFAKTKQAYPNVDQVGISGYDIVKPQFKDRSSAADENTNRKAVFDDMCTLAERIDDLAQLLEDRQSQPLRVRHRATLRSTIRMQGCQAAQSPEHC